jgi:NitT/TauT family transport system permease protein
VEERSVATDQITLDEPPVIETIHPPAPLRHRRRLRGGAVKHGLLLGLKGSVGIVVLLGAWEILPRTGLINRTFLPPFSEVAKTWWDLLTQGILLPNVWASLQRALEGLAASILIGVPLGLVMGWYRRVREFLFPVLEIFRNTAPIALLPVFILFLGLGQVSKVSVIVYACVWPVLLNTIAGVRNADRTLIKSAQSLGFSPIQIFRKVVIPSALPSILAGIRLAGTFSILMVLIAETVGATSGLGYYVNLAEETSQIPQMYATILTITMIGLLMNGTLALVEQRVLSWRPPPSGSS